MKNKEIEELLKGMRDVSNTDGACMNLDRYLVKLLLSYIEQLEKENEFLKLDNPNANIKHFEMLKENKRKIDNLRYQKKQLESNRDKAIEYLHQGKFRFWEMENILKSDNNGN